VSAHLHDLIFAVASAVLLVAMLPAVRRRSLMPVSTCMVTGSVVLVLSLNYATMAYWYATAVEFANASCWAFLLCVALRARVSGTHTRVQPALTECAATICPGRSGDAPEPGARRRVGDGRAMPHLTTGASGAVVAGGQPPAPGLGHQRGAESYTLTGVSGITRASVNVVRLAPLIGKTLRTGGFDVTDFLDAKRKEIADRLKELKPAVDEYNRLEAAASALDTPALRRRGPGRPRGAARTTSASGKPGKAAGKKAGRPSAGRPGRRKGSGTRAAQALSFVESHPGITIPELAKKMGIKQNYLYRVLPGLEQEKKVTKRDGGWHPQPAA
jgi:hypothetical protein